MKLFILFVFGIISSFSTFAAEQVNFLARPMTAGKASLTDSGFIINQTIGTANFSPELRYPIQLIYNSISEKTGIFGFGWSSPQLESSAYYDKDGCLWTTPWGEKIKFFAKDEKLPKDAIKLELYEQEKKGRGFFAPYSDWEATTTTPSNKLSMAADWIFTGKRDFKGWKFVYRDAKLQNIFAPSGRVISFSYSRDKVTRIAQDNQVFVEISYDKNVANSITINGITQKLSYTDTQVVIMPKTVDGKVITADRPALTSLQLGDLNPVEFTYSSGYLSKIKQGDFVDNLRVESETFSDRISNLSSRDPANRVRHSGKVAGRLLEDSFLKYSYPSEQIGQVELKNQLNQTASYNYDSKVGVFKII